MYGGTYIPPILTDFSGAFRKKCQKISVLKIGGKWLGVKRRVKHIHLTFAAKLIYLTQEVQRNGCEAVRTSDCGSD